MAVSIKMAVSRIVHTAVQPRRQPSFYFHSVLFYSVPFSSVLFVHFT
jgi:hypothetical protein